MQFSFYILFFLKYDTEEVRPYMYVICCPCTRRCRMFSTFCTFCIETHLYLTTRVWPIPMARPEANQLHETSDCPPVTDLARFSSPHGRPRARASHCMHGTSANARTRAPPRARALRRPSFLAASDLAGAPSSRWFVWAAGSGCGLSRRAPPAVIWQWFVRAGRTCTCMRGWWRC